MFLLASSKGRGSDMSDVWSCRPPTRPIRWLAPLGTVRRGLKDFIRLVVGTRSADFTASTSEVALVQSMNQQGSGGAQAVYRLHSERVMRFIYWRVGEQYEDAEDVTLETFLSAATLCHTFDGRVSVYLWLCGIAKLRIIDHHRHRKRAKRMPPEPPVCLDSLEDQAFVGHGSPHMDALINQISASQMVDLALRRLSDHEREALLLNYAEGLSMTEIGQQLNRSDEAVRSLIRRAEGKLRCALAELIEEGGK